MAPKYLTSPPNMPGMPKGVPYIVGNEAAERFSFYGMKAILVVFMTEYLRADDDTLATMSEPRAKFWLHTFVVAAYFFPLIGAILADWMWGKYRTILWLSIVYCLGHLSLALDETRLGLGIGLSLIALGTGAIKPCVSAHVGDQFGTGNTHLLPKVFGWFYLAINLGAFLSTLLTPILLNTERFYDVFGQGLREVSWIRPGPHLAFGVPGVLMAIATLVFWLGRNVFVHVPPRGATFLRESFTGEGWAAIRRLLPVYAFVAAFWCLFDQTASAWVLQAKQMDRQWLGVEWLASQLQAVNPLFILLLVPTFSYVVYPAIDRVFRLTPLRKIGIGMFLTVLAFSVSALIEMQIRGGRTVAFKIESTQPELSNTSTFDGANHGADKLLDGSAAGWISGTIGEKNALPQHVVIRLRERRSWAIDSVRVDPRVDLENYLERRKKANEEFVPPAPEAYFAREVTVLTSDSPVGPWTPAGEIEITSFDSPTDLAIPGVQAEYVMLRVDRNGGADAVAIGEVEILARGEGGTVNVAATGYKPSIGWQVLAYAILTAAEVMVSITCLEFSYTQAPNAMKSVVMAVFLLSIAAGNEFTAVVNLMIERPDGTSRLPGASYYWFFTAVMAFAALGFVVAAARYRGRTYIQGEDAALHGEATEEAIAQ